MTRAALLVVLVAAGVAAAPKKSKKAAKGSAAQASAKGAAEKPPQGEKKQKGKSKPGAAETPPPPPPPVTAATPLVEENLSDTVREILAASDHVQAFRVADTGGLRPDPARAIGSDFVREAPGKVLTSGELVLLKSVFYDQKSYRFDQDVSRCNFTPQVGFSMSAPTGVATVEALVSFSCSQVLFFVGKPGGRWLPGGTFDIKPARDRLLTIAKTTLADDKPTQALK